MAKTSLPPIERNVARCRVVLSVASLLAIYVDPTEPAFGPARATPGQWFSIDAYTLTTVLLHFGYSLAAYAVVTRGWVAAPRIIAVTMWSDVFFSVAIALFTEGVSSPFYAFFAFAVVQVGLRSGFRQTMFVTGVSLSLYLSLILFSADTDVNFYIMRPVYLAIIGYFVAYMGQQRLNLEAEIHALAAADQRNRIARDLHDGWAQALAGINLRIESCRRMLKIGRSEDAMNDLGDLQGSVRREYDELRGYMRSLAGLESEDGAIAVPRQTRFSVRAEFTGEAPLVDHVLQVLREGVSNVVRHAAARSARLSVVAADGMIIITIDDDGTGFVAPEIQPWSIASRVRELNGEMEVLHDSRPGAHLRISVPQAETTT